MNFSRVKSYVCAFAAIAVAFPVVTARPAPQDGSSLKLGREYAPAPGEEPVNTPSLDDVKGALARLETNGTVRHLRLNKKTGRAAALFGSLEGAGAAKRPAAEHAREFLVENAALVGTVETANETVVERSVETPTGSHVFLRQQIGERPVFDASAAIHIGNDGAVYGLTSTLAPAIDPILAVAPPAIDEEAARALALARLGVTPENLRDEDPSLAELGVAPVGNGLLAWRLVVPVREPFGQWELFVDATTGDVIGEPRSLVLGDGTAKVFVPNPIVSTGVTTLVDSNNSNSAVPDAAYIQVNLRGIDASGYLTGPYVSTDRTPDRLRAPNGNFTSVRRSESGFNELEAYWAIDTAQRYLQSIGVTNAANYQIRVNARAFSDDNSNYSASGDGTGVLNFGWGGVDDAQDAEIVWHEYGHAILDNQARLFFGGESGAMHEGFGDYVAATLSTTVAGDSRFYPYIGEWDATSYSGGPIPFLRRVDTTKRYPQDLRNQVHTDGEIWSSCLWAVHKALGRDAANRIIFNANFLFPRDVGFEDGAAAIVEADRQLNGGANAAAIATAFGAHGIDLGAVGPSVTSVRLKKGKKLIVDGDAFEINGAVVEIDGESLGRMKYPQAYRRKGVSKRITSKDAAVAALQPGVAVEVTVYNPASGARSAPFVFTP